MTPNGSTEVRIPLYLIALVVVLCSIIGCGIAAYLLFPIGGHT